MSSAVKKDANQLFPVFLKLENFRVLIVGGGLVALEKLNALLQNAPATSIRVVARQFNNKIKVLARKYKNVELVEKKFEANDLEKIDLVITAVNDLIKSKQIYSAAHRKKILINTADTPALCDFYLGSIVQKGSLKIAISTNGKSPTIAKRLKEVFASALPNELDQVLGNLHVIRGRLRGDFTNKVKTLNKITRVLASSVKPGRIRKLARKPS